MRSFSSFVPHTLPVVKYFYYSYPERFAPSTVLLFFISSVFPLTTGSSPSDYKYTPGSPSLKEISPLPFTSATFSYLPFTSLLLETVTYIVYYCPSRLSITLPTPPRSGFLKVKSKSLLGKSNSTFSFPLASDPDSLFLFPTALPTWHL